MVWWSPWGINILVCIGLSSVEVEISVLIPDFWDWHGKFQPLQNEMLSRWIKKGAFVTNLAGVSLELIRICTFVELQENPTFRLPNQPVTV